MVMALFRVLRFISTFLALTASALVIYVLLTDSSYFAGSKSAENVRSQVVKGDGFFTVPLHARRSASYITATVGTSTQMDILIDSGSDHFWIRENFLSDAANISTQLFSVEYAGGNASGLHGREEFSVGSINWRQRLGVVTAASPQLKEVQSVMGVSRKCRDSALCALPHWRLKEVVISFFYDFHKDEGRFLAGHVLDDSDSACRLNWIPATDSFYWTTHVQMYAGAERVGEGTSLKAVWDTGTSFLYLSERLHQQVTRKFPGKDEPCNIRKLPVLEFEIGNQRYALPGLFYATVNLDKTCSYQIGLLESRWVGIIGAEILIGWVFLQTHYVAFHIEKDAVGICAHQDLSNNSFRGFRIKT